MRLTPEKRAELLADLKLREQLTDQRLMEKYAVSRATLWRVLEEDRWRLPDEDRVKQYASDIARRQD